MMNLCIDLKILSSLLSTVLSIGSSFVVTTDHYGTSDNCLEVGEIQFTGEECTYISCKFKSALHL